MFREHHFEHVVNGGAATAGTIAEKPVAPTQSCDALCAAPATQFTTQQGAAPDSREPHKTTEPAATIQVAAGSSKRAPVTETGPRHDAAQKSAGRGHGWPCRRKVAGTGTEQTRYHSVNRKVASNRDADCDAISADRIELLARAVVLVAGMKLPEAARIAVLTRAVAELTDPVMRTPE